jgi:hypothetical protein
MSLRALTDAEDRRRRKHERKLLDAWKRKEISTERVMALKAAYRATLGKSVPDELVGKAVREHGDRGLGALTVAAEWTLAAPQVSHCTSTNGRQPRPRRATTARRARSPGRSTRAGDGDPEPDLAAQLARLISAGGYRSACELAKEVGRRKADVLEALHRGGFVQVGRGRAAKWGVVAVPAVLVRYRDEVWKARRKGLIDADETLELLLDPKPRVLEMLAEVAA